MFQVKPFFKNVGDIDFRAT